MNESEELKKLVQTYVDAELQKHRRKRLKIAGLIAVMIPMALWAATKPFHFSAGQEIKASEMNANFDALFNEKKMVLIYETDVTANTNSVIIPNLDGNVDIEYQVVARLKSGVGSAAYYLRVNGDTANNYGQAYIQTGATGATVPATIGLALGGSSATLGDWGLYNGILHAAVSGNTPRMFVTTYVQQVSGTAANQAGINGSTWNNTTANITQLEVYSNLAGGIAAGSHIEIWARR